MPDYFMDKNHNKERVLKCQHIIGRTMNQSELGYQTLMQMEYEQPIHIEHETKSTDDETENPTEARFQIDVIQLALWLVKSATI